MKRGDRKRLAEALGVSERLLRYVAQQEERPRLGRPPHEAKLQRATLMACGRELGRQGWTTGWRQVAGALPHLPEGLIKAFVPALKARHRGRVARMRAR